MSKLIAEELSGSILSLLEYTIGVAEKLIERALSIYTSQCGSTHEATISCKVLSLQVVVMYKVHFITLLFISG